MANPKVLLLDEPSMGLAPVLVDSIFETIEALNQARNDNPARRTKRAYGAADCQPGLCDPDWRNRAQR